MRCAVLGDPIAHSLSPALHRAAYGQLGLDWSYDAVRVASGTLAPFLAGLDASWRGLSLTMPLKREVLPLAATVSATAALAGGANTLIRRADGGWDADNTDVPGAEAAIAARVPGPADRVTIWGGGATAASVLLALARRGCREVTLLVRDPGRAGETLAVAERVEGLSVFVGSLEDRVSADLLVSTVPAAAQPPLLGRLGEVGAVFEVVYDPWPTPLAARALDLGVPLVTGLDLLAHQAALQLFLFTGRTVPVPVLVAAGTAALGSR